MATIVMANTGTPILLNYLLQRTANNYPDWLLMLWTNSSLFPTPATVYADLSEATFTGYARQTIIHAGWGAPAIISSTFARSTYGSLFSWTNTGSAQPIYGYAVITPSPFTLIYCQKFDAPAPMDPGGTLQFSPIIDFGTKT